MTEKEIYKNGVALLEEWEDVNYCEHSFKFKDEWITDKEVVDLLKQLNDENEELKKELARQQLINTSMKTEKGIDKLQLKIKKLIDENEQLKQFIMELTTKNNGRIDLANGYSYNVKYVLKGVWKND